MDAVNEIVNQVIDQTRYAHTVKRNPKSSRFYGTTVGVPAICKIHGRYTKTIENYGAPDAIEHGCYQCEEETRDGSSPSLQQRINDNLMNCGIPKRFNHCTFDSFIQSEQNKKAYQVAKSYADNFDSRLEHGGGLLFHGKCGTGKTHLACAIAKQVIYAGESSVLYSRIYDIVSDVKSSWSNKQIREVEVLQKYIRPHLLIIDEVGVQFGTEAERLVLFQIMNKRYEDIKPTILLSNLDMKELTECIGERLIDRMREGGGARIGFTWDSYRS